MIPQRLRNTARRLRAHRPQRERSSHHCFPEEGLDGRGLLTWRMTPGSGPARLSKRITARRRGLDGRPRGPTARRGEGEAAAACETPPLDAEPVTTQGGGAYKRLGFTCPRCAPACYGPGVPRNPRMPGLNRPFSQVHRPGNFGAMMITIPMVIPAAMAVASWRLEYARPESSRKD